MNEFVFEKYTFDHESYRADFYYRLGEYSFRETVHFQQSNNGYDVDVLSRALKLAHLVIGVSYYKTFPTSHITFMDQQIDSWQANFLNNVYQEGLSQFAYENNLTREDLAFFKETSELVERAAVYSGQGTLSLQSGGKDSLLSAMLLDKQQQAFDSMYVANSESHPALIDTLGEQLYVVRRDIDKAALATAAENGAKNGHIPITYIISSIALVQSVLLNKNTVLLSIGHEGEEPHAMIGNLGVTHQWSKTWSAEQLLAGYVQRYIAENIRVGSPLRKYSELRIAQLFVEHAWGDYGHSFSSCNKINYQQGNDNTVLKWCGECPKCANSFLLFAPFVSARELTELFGGQDLFAKPLLVDTFKGLLGIDGFEKPFECIGEIDELRKAYELKQNGYASLPFYVPASDFSLMAEYPYQRWTDELIA